MDETKTPDQACARCGEHSTKLMKCSRCLNVQYCNADCQKQAWKEGHKAVCQGGEESSGPKIEASEEERMMIDTFGQAKKLMESNDLHLAIETFQAVIAISKELLTRESITGIPEKVLGIKLIQSKSFRNLGMILIESDPQGARTYLDSALRIVQKLKALPEGQRHPELPLDEAEALDNLGMLALLRGDLLGALASYSRSLKLLEGLRHGAGLVVAYGNLGLVLYRLERLPAAQQMFDRQVLLARTNPAYGKYLAAGLNNSGICDVRRRDVVEAAGKFVQALIHARTARDAEQERVALVNILNNSVDPAKSALYLGQLQRLEAERRGRAAQAACRVCAGPLETRVVHVVPACLH
eukprot:CAMPEP_0206362818 /NCGR_PEP_ID=MMETSP0294-20121207/1214_1 /ASSEMBLY_ACC=CAM_ASM_000327 /TAXON_ID=39354 /ORGANISM="Heterosigma akashiwo, Strain CCMP2393" /LENGTH=353 /DNA_ID=CAMNT_0053808027 /DNA_START=27 /DNA_END=1085 /DNA_ORIENTATION=+